MVDDMHAEVVSTPGRRGRMMTENGGGPAVVLAAQSGINNWQEDFYKSLHQHPELGHQEVKTAAAVAAALRGFGYEVREKIGSTGVVSILKNGEGPIVLMRADMDALPVAETTGLPYASTGHATDRDGIE